MLFLLWFLFLLIGIAFSSSPATSLLSLFPFSNFKFQISNFSSPALPLPESWSITLSSLASSIKNAFLGVGLGNFENAFTRFRPAGLNSNELWFWNFNHSVSPALTILVEQGLLGLFFWFWLFYLSYQSYQSYLPYDQEFYFVRKTRILIKFLFSVIALSAISFLFLPLPLPYFPLIPLLSLISFLILFFLFAKKKIPGFHLISLTRLTNLLLAGTACGLFVFFLFFSPQINPQTQIQKAEASLLSAENLASNPKQNEKKIKEYVVSSLVSGSRAVSLSPENARVRFNFVLLLKRMNNLIANSPSRLSKEFSTLLVLDPRNPQVYLELGRYQFKQGDLNGAISSFKNAISLKADYPPAWFDLYQAYAESQNLKEALKALNETRRLVCEVKTNTKDCEKIKTLLAPPK